MWRILAIVYLRSLVWAAQGPFPVAIIHVEGNARYTPEAIIGASGLAVGTPASPPDFEAACKRLVETGLFNQARFRFKSAVGAPAFDLTLAIEEAQDLRETRIEIPEIEEARVWAWMKQNEPLIQPQMPANGQAEATYLHAIERFLASQGIQQTIVARLRTDFKTGALTNLFRPTELPKVTAVRIEGASGIPAATVEAVLAKVAIGSEYAESSFRELLDYNARRLYEDEGHLGVQFLRVNPSRNPGGGFTVSTTVSEGPLYRLAGFEIAGDRIDVARLRALIDLKQGEVASSKRIALNAAKIREALGHDGYLNASSEIERQLDSTQALAHITFVVEKGQRSRFGALAFEGLDALSEAHARALWSLPSGAVLNTEIVEKFLRTLMHDDQIRFKHVGLRYKPRPDSDLVDVIFVFK